MPTTPLKNLLYRVGLVLFAPSVSTQLTLARVRGEEELALSPDYGPGHLLKRNHVLGGTLTLGEQDALTVFLASTRTSPKRIALPDTLYRAASLTKMATALCVLRLCEKGLLSLDACPLAILPSALPANHPLRRATVEQFLSHRSGLRNGGYEAAFLAGTSYDEALMGEGVFTGNPGETFSYCNFAFGLLGSLVEQVTGESVEYVLRREVFEPLGMDATLDVTQVPAGRAMPISRVLPYVPSRTYKPEKAAATAKPLDAADPLHHYGYTAGSMYATAPAMDRLLRMLAQGGELDGAQFLRPETVQDMTRPHATYGELSPGMHYGLGLVILEDPALGAGRILGHQGFAFGCVDGAFYQADTGRRVVLLDGGASEARVGRLGRLNRDLIRWAFDGGNEAWL